MPCQGKAGGREVHAELPLPSVREGDQGLENLQACVGLATLGSRRNDSLPTRSQILVAAALLDPMHVDDRVPMDVCWQVSVPSQAGKVRT